MTYFEKMKFVNDFIRSANISSADTQFIIDRIDACLNDKTRSVTESTDECVDELVAYINKLNMQNNFCC